MTGDVRLLAGAERIMILGCSGGGKSTLARELGGALGLPVVHLDKLFWRPGWVETRMAEFIEITRWEAEKDRWIIDGGYDETLEYRLSRCDAILYLDLPRRVCLFRALRRVVRYRGKTRPDMGPDCPEKMDREFFLWIWNYRRAHRGLAERLAAALPPERVFILQKRRDAGALLRHLREDN